jgi:hypothetical protein
MSYSTQKISDNIKNQFIKNDINNQNKDYKEKYMEYCYKMKEVKQLNKMKEIEQSNKKVNENGGYIDSDESIENLILSSSDEEIIDDIDSENESYDALTSSPSMPKLSKPSEPKKVWAADEEKNMKLNKELLSDKNKDKVNDNSDVEIDTDGLSYDEYSQLSLKKKFKMNSGVGFCESCGKYYPDFMVIEHDSAPYCWHCMFWLSSSDVFSDKVLEETYGLTLDKYLEFCSPCHKRDECTKGNTCIICTNSSSMVELCDELSDDSDDFVLEVDI